MRLTLKFLILIGVWLIVAPWVLRFASVTTALWSSVVAGSVLGLIGLWGLYGNPSDPPEKP